MLLILKKLRFLEKRPRMTKSGEIIYEEKEKGNIYVKGILVTNQNNALLSYDIQNL